MKIAKVNAVRTKREVPKTFFAHFSSSNTLKLTTAV